MIRFLTVVDQEVGGYMPEAEIWHENENKNALG